MEKYKYRIILKTILVDDEYFENSNLVEGITGVMKYVKKAYLLDNGMIILEGYMDRHEQFELTYISLNKQLENIQKAKIKEEIRDLLVGKLCIIRNRFNIIK